MTPEAPNHYEANIAILKERHRHVWDFLAQSSAKPLGEVLLAPNGNPNLKLITVDGSEIFLHDTNVPEVEAPQFLAMVPAGEAAVVTLTGMGLGYTPAALLRERPEIRHLAVFELEPGIFLRALELMDLSEFLTDPRLIISLGAEPALDKLKDADRALRLETIHCLNHNASFAYNPEAYQLLHEKVYSFVNEYNVGGITSLTFGKDFISNRLKHLSSIRHNYLLESLRNVFQGIPAMIVAGGPSLDKNIQHLAAAKGRAVIIAVDSVLPALLANGITPDFVTSIDPTDFTYEKIAPAAGSAHGISLICMPWVGPKVPKIFPADRVFWCFSGLPIEEWLNSMLGGKILTMGAQTVAHLNFLAATIMGCSPIVFVGQDLAYTDNKDHASHTVFTAHDLMKETLASKDNLKWVKGVDGNMVPTDRAFFSMKNIFERMIASQDGHYINATEGGAHIEGTEVLPLVRVLEQFCQTTHNVEDRIKKHSDKTHLARTKKILTELSSILTTIKGLKKTINTADGITDSLMKEIADFQRVGIKHRFYAGLPKAMQSRMMKVDACHKKIDGEKKIWKILEEITLAGLKDSERMLHEIKKIDGDPDHYLEWLNKHYVRFKALNSVRKQVLAFFESNIKTILTHLRKEEKIKNSLKKKTDAALELEMARLYMESGDIILAAPLLDKLLAALPDKAEIHFYRGMVSAYYEKFDDVETHFNTATGLDARFIEQVNDFRRKLGDQYYSYKGFCMIIDRNAFRKMLLKGLRFCKDHPQIRRELQDMAAEDLEKIKLCLEKNSGDEVIPVIEMWCGDLRTNENLADALSGGKASEFFFYKGKQLLNKNDYDGAVTAFKEALFLTPNNPELHACITAAYFDMADFASGIQHLQQAVNLDRGYAHYWENIGDTLHASGRHQDAVAAYEQCFVNLPERVRLLGKMGDCYQALGQPEAAAEAYRQQREHEGRTISAMELNR